MRAFRLLTICFIKNKYRFSTNNHLRISLILTGIGNRILHILTRVSQNLTKWCMANWKNLGRLKQLRLWTLLDVMISSLSELPINYRA
jgi:hypothetical protein